MGGLFLVGGMLTLVVSVGIGVRWGVHALRRWRIARVRAVDALDDAQAAADLFAQHRERERIRQEVLRGMAHRDTDPPDSGDVA